MLRISSLVCVVVSLFIIILVAPNAKAQLIVDICDRTPEVRDEILSEVSYIIQQNCATVTEEQLLSIRTLRLGGKGITSLKENDFADLSELTRLELENNSITELPEEIFAGLSNLDYLSLENNSLASTLHADLFAGLSSLKELSLDGNALESLPPDLFSGLPLTSLALYDNDLTELPPDLFAGLSELQFLDLQENSLTTLPANIFAGLSNLNRLHIFDNPINTLPAGLYADLSSLTLLNLQNQSLTSLPANFFEGLTGLIELRLNGNDFTTLPANIFADLSSLESLGLTGIPFKSLPAGTFAGLSNLKNLYLDNSSLSTSVLPSNIFAGLSSLEYIGLSYNLFETLPANIFAGLSNLQTIYIPYNFIAELPRNVLVGLTSLKNLDLYSNLLTTLPANIFDDIQEGFLVDLGYQRIDCLPQKILDLEEAGTIEISADREINPCAEAPSEVTLELNRNVITEGESTTVIANLSAPMSTDIEVEVSAKAIAPALDSDYTLSEDRVLTIPSGEITSTESVTIMTDDDQIDSPDKIVTVSGIVTTESNVLNPEDQTLTITDNDEAPTRITLTVNPTEVKEDAGSKEVTVTATLDVARIADTPVTISVEDVTAVAETDYTIVDDPLELTILARQISGAATFTFTPILDNVDEPDETVQVTGTTPVDGLEVSEATLMLIDSDPTPELTLGLSMEALPEDGGQAMVTASLNGKSSSETTIMISASAINPATDSDYTLSGNVLTIAAGETESTEEVTITPVDNDIDEPDKIVTVSGQVNTPGVTNPEDVTLTIQDDDHATKITLTVAPIGVNEDTENTSVTVTATLDTPRSTDTELTISVESGTATSGIDFADVTPFALTIPAEAIKGTETFTFAPIMDGVDEPDEEVQIAGTTPVEGLDIGRTTLILFDSDPTPEVILNLDPEEIMENGGQATVTASLSVASSVETMITISMVAILPTIDSDYIPSSNLILMIPSGVTTSTGEVTITAVNNLVDAPDKTVTVSGLAENTQGVIGPPEVTLTILDDDEATGVTLNVEPPEVNEDDGNTVITVTATLDTQRSEDTEVLVSIREGSALVGTDYEDVPSFDMTIPAEEFTVTETFDLTLVDDLIYEQPETITIIGESSALGPGETGNYLTILDDDELITLTIQDQMVSEDVGMAQILVEVSPAPPTDLIIPFQTFEVDAKEGEDYQVPQYFFEIPAGNTEAFLDIQIMDDPIMESAETFQVRLSEVEGTALDPGEATVTIEDDDVYLLRVEDASELESSGSLTFTVILDPPHPSQTVRVGYETRDGTAIATTDYVFQRGILDFPPNIDRRELSVPLVDDFEAEMVETFLLELSTPEHAELADDQATGTILDDDAPPIANLAPSLTVQEDAGLARFEVTLTHSLPGRETEVDFIVTDQTAQASLDYQMQTQSPLRFPSGQTTQFIEVQILDDELFEGQETFQVQLTNIQNGELGQSEGQGIIVDNEDPVTGSIQDVTVVESEAEAVFPVILSGQDSRERTFTYTTEDETAETGQDYEARTGTIIFPPGTVRQDIRVPILDNLETENTETFQVRLSGDGLSDGEAQGTIQDDDGPLTVSIYDERVSEGAGSLLLPVRLSRPSSQLVTVRFTSSDETAQAESDYVTSQGIVIFGRGSTEGNVRIQVLEDSEVESEETFRVTLSGARNAAIARSIGTVTILDNDGSPGVSVQSVTVSNRAATFEVNLSKPSPLPVLVSYASEDGSAQAGEDYEPVAGQITFAPGEVSKTMEVKLLAKQSVWEMKTFSLVLLSAVNAEVHEARTEVVMEEESEENIQDAYVSRVLRTWASQVVEGLSRRMEGMAQCRVPDLSWLRYGTERRSLGQIFSGCGAQYTEGGWSVWGQGAFTRMSGREGALSLHSDVTTMLVGADYAWSQGWMAGLLAAQNWDQGTYETPTRSGTASSQLTGLYPYVSYQTGTGMRTWVLLGLGRGETEVDMLESEVDAALVALGLTGTLTEGTTGRLSYEVDAFWATADVENRSDLGVRRVRAGVEGSLRFGPGLQPYMEAALRQDGGDAETGVGIELGGGVRWSTSRLRAELGGRTLMLHTDEGMREWGLMGAIEYGSPGGLGPSMRVRPLWGNVYGGNLWRETPLHSMGQGRTDQRVEMELGYGTPIKKSLGRSIVGMTMDPRGRAYRIGYNLHMKKGLQFSVATTARTVEANEPLLSYGISARMDLKW